MKKFLKSNILKIYYFLRGCLAFSEIISSKLLFKSHMSSLTSFQNVKFLVIVLPCNSLVESHQRTNSPNSA